MHGKRLTLSLARSLRSLKALSRGERHKKDKWVVVSLSCLSLILPFRVVREFSGWWPVVGDQWLVASCQWLDVPFGLSVHFPRRLIM